MGVVVEVRPPGAVIEEPGLRRPCHPLDELLGVAAPLVVQERKHGNGDLLDLLERAVARRVDEALVERHVVHPLRAVLAVDDFGEEVGIPPFRVHVRHGQEAVEVVESDVLGLTLAVLAHVPLPDGLRHVAGVREQFGEGDLAAEAAGHAVHGRDEEAVAHREAARHDGRSGGGARRFAVARGQQQSAPGDAIDVGCRCAHGDPAAVAAKVTPPDVVHQDDDHVGAPTGAGAELRHFDGRRLVAARDHEGGFPVGAGTVRVARDGVEGPAAPLRAVV